MTRLVSTQLYMQCTNLRMEVCSNKPSYRLLLFKDFLCALRTHLWILMWTQNVLCACVIFLSQSFLPFFHISKSLQLEKYCKDNRLYAIQYNNPTKYINLNILKVPCLCYIIGLFRLSSNKETILLDNFSAYSKIVYKIRRLNNYILKQYYSYHNKLLKSHTKAVNNFSIARKTNFHFAMHGL